MFCLFLFHLPYLSLPLFSPACPGFHLPSSLTKSEFHFHQKFQFCLRFCISPPQRLPLGFLMKITRVSLFLSPQPPYNTMRLLLRRERFCFNVICALRALEYHLNYDLLQVLGFTWHFVSIITYHFTFVSFLLCVFNSSCLNRKIKIGSKTLTKCVTSKSMREVRRHHMWHQN